MHWKSMSRINSWKCQQNADWTASRPLKKWTCKRITLTVCLCVCLSLSGFQMGVKRGQIKIYSSIDHSTFNVDCTVASVASKSGCECGYVTLASRRHWKRYEMSVVTIIFLASTCQYDSVRSHTHGHCLSVLFCYRMLFYPLARTLSHGGLMGEESTGGGMYITNCIDAEETLLWSCKG